MKRIVFMGTPEFAVNSLKALINYPAIEVVGVVSQPDRPYGRKGTLTPPPVKQLAEEKKVEVYQPENIGSSDSIEKILSWQADLIVTAAYGQILPQILLDQPIHGAINVHASLLPQYRGAAPIHYAILNGDEKTGVTLMYMEKSLDTGDIIGQLEYPISPSQTTGDLFEALADLGASLLIDKLEAILSGQVNPQAQNHDQATYAPAIDKKQERIDWQQSAQAIDQLVRALSPQPGAYTLLDGQRFKIWEAEVVDQQTVHAPATVVKVEKKYFYVAAGQGTVLKVKTVQPAGKKAMATANFLNGGGQFLEEGFEFDG